VSRLGTVVLEPPLFHPCRRGLGQVVFLGGAYAYIFKEGRNAFAHGAAVSEISAFIRAAEVIGALYHEEKKNAAAANEEKQQNHEKRFFSIVRMFGHNSPLA
jgi:hypothetical protein